MFAIKLFSPSPIKFDYGQISELYRAFLVSHDTYFKNCICPEYPPPGTNDFLIIDQNNHRQIVISNTHLQYMENKKLNIPQFNNICKSLYEFYITKLQIKPTDIKVIGKVCNYKVSAIGLYNKFIEKYKLIEGEKISKFQFAFSLVKNDKNIHFQANCTEPDDLDDEPAELLLQFDINNRDQATGLKGDSFKEIFEFSDKFHKDDVLNFLNNKLFYGAKD